MAGAPHTLTAGRDQSRDPYPSGEVATMPIDPASPSYIFVQALLGEAPDPHQLLKLNPEWRELIQAAQDATPTTACAGKTILNPWGDWLEPLNLYLLVSLPPGHRKSAVFASIVQPLQQYEADAAQVAAPQIAQARRIRHAAEQALLRAETA